MTRSLTKADREIWDRLRETVRPLRKRKAAGPGEVAEMVEQAAAEPARKKAVARTPAAPTPVAKRQPPAPALTPLEEKTRRRLGRGLVAIDASIDLHGMRQERAYAALVAFLRHAQARGDRIALIVTGKGKAGEGGRGVLRHAVPGWLSRPDLRPLVVGFESAGRRHGGDGALYVRIRRRRAGPPPASPLG